MVSVKDSAQVILQMTDQFVKAEKGAC